MVRNIVFVLFLFFLTGCSRELNMLGWFFGEVDVNERFEIAMQADEESRVRRIYKPGNYKVLMGTDLHYSDANVTFAPFLERATREEYAFVTILGDFMLDKDGNHSVVKKQLEMYPDMTFMAVVGNHDVYKGQWEKFMSAFGIASYMIEVVLPECKDLFIVLDGANATLGRQQMQWLENSLRRDRKKYRYCFVLVHTNFFIPNNKVDFVSIFSSEEKARMMRLFTENGVNALFSGHSHYHTDVVVNSVRYISLSGLKEHIKDSESCVLKCSDAGVEIEFEPIANN